MPSGTAEEMEHLSSQDAFGVAQVDLEPSGGTSGGGLHSWACVPIMSLWLCHVIKDGELLI